jgi:hypothetical protein
MVERSFGDITDDEMLAAAVRSDSIIRERFPDITWEHSHVCVDDEGSITTYCVYDAPSPDAVREHASALGGHTIKRIHEIADDVTPMEVRRRAGVS